MKCRRGITLLEVLISIAVVAGGLLGVAALLTLGSYTVNETAKADRSAAMGRAAMHDVRVRRMLERLRDGGAARWYVARYEWAMDDSPGGSRSFRRRFLIGQPFAIDPLFATEAAVSGTSDYFECFPFKDSSVFLFGDPNLARLQLNIFEGVFSDRQQLAVLDRIFRWRDDLIFDIDEDNPDNRPRQSCLWSDGTVAPYPDTSATANPLHAQTADNYSWMLTAVPDPGELPITSDINVLTAHEQQTYTVSIVTFYKRDFTCDATADPPSERFAGIDFIGTGIGGGDAILMSPPAVTSMDQAEKYLKVKENEWIMVTGFVREPRLDPIVGFYTGNINSGIRRIAKWYRVIRVDDEVEGSGPFTRNITLAGPDWDQNWQNNIIFYDNAGIPTGNEQYNQPRATIIEGAIGVYTTTVTH